MSQQRVAVVRTATTDGRRQWPWPARDAAAATVFWRRKRVQRSRRRLRQQRREDRNRGGRRRKRRTRKRAATTCGCCGRKGGKEDYGSGSSGWKSRRKQRRLEERATAVAGSWQRRQRRRWAREEEDSSRRLRMAGAGGCCDRGDCGRGKKRRQRGPATKQAAGASAMGSVDVASGGDSGRGWAATGRGGRKRAAAVRRGLWRQREERPAVAAEAALVGQGGHYLTSRAVSLPDIDARQPQGRRGALKNYFLRSSFGPDINTTRRIRFNI
ncbi:hypothetical protein BHM03_00030654 [Ensete ventricosum]|nr:hypothetical protein BHM03_00030654 [Ensete ventricosum]